MKFLSNKTRLLLSVLLLISFFIPAFKNISAFNFINLAISEANEHNDITMADALIIVAPLFLIPLIAIVVFIRSYKKVPLPTTVTGLPLLLLLFFFAVLYFTGNISNVSLPTSKLLFNLQLGFYLIAIASLLLLFTRNGRLHRSKRKKHSPVKATPVLD